MTAPICGHDREALRRALEFANSSNLDAVSRNWPRPSDDGAILFDVRDPAKLAEMLAERGRQLGLDCVACSTPEALAGSSERYAFCGIVAGVDIWTEFEKETYVMSQARSLLAAWLRLKDGDRKGAEKALREING